MISHAGKILRLDLTKKQTDIIPTSKYEDWIGGIGIATALFFDEVDKDYITDTAGITGFEPENVICVMTGVMCGTMVPGNAKTEVCGIAPETYPRPQFIRSSIGSYFGPMLKYAGYDGIVIKGKADTPVWMDIRDDDIKIKDAKNLWGKGFFGTQDAIWKEIEKDKYPYLENQSWFDAATRQSAILGIGQAGENLSRVACLLHGADSAAGLGGFGGVFGSKNLKAISVIGTGSIEVAHPEKLMDTWIWVREKKPKHFMAAFPVKPIKGIRHIGCFGCTSTCKKNTTEKEMPGSDGQCAQVFYYMGEDNYAHGKSTSASHIASRVANDYGINVLLIWASLVWLEYLHEQGLLGKGKQIDTNLDFSKLGTEEFIKEYIRMIAFHEDIGADLCEGHVRAAAKWGLLEDGLMSGMISAIHWGIGEQHWTNSINWAYTSLFDGRDINAHDMDYYSDLESVCKRYAELAPPWHDELMLDHSEEGVYSVHCARWISFTQRFYNVKGSMAWCDYLPFDTFNENTPDGKGISPEMEERYYHAVTGEEMTWEQLLELGRKIWNFKRSILVLNGRHRNEEYFPPYPPYNSYVYTEGPPTLQWGNIVGKTQIGGMMAPVKKGEKFRNFDLKSMTDVMEPSGRGGGHSQTRYPVYKDGKWEWSIRLFHLNKDKMDEFKTKFYELEGWDTDTGWPTKSALAGCGLEYVADVLERQGKRLKS